MGARAMPILALQLIRASEGQPSGLIQSFSTSWTLADASPYRQQGRNVVHPHLHAGADRLEISQSEQVECCSSQTGKRTSTITPVMVLVHMELGVTDPVPACPVSTT